ncbi:MAG: TRAP transporter substrate-binding protein [bacterium]|nr:TRAP transporter substrate-binding protein [bacterium]
MTRLPVAAAAVALTMAGSLADDTWIMPTACDESSYQTEIARTFAEAVRVCTAGRLAIEVHAGGSLIGGGAIKRAVETGDVAIGERLLSAHADDNPVFAYDSVPFLATSFDSSERLWQAARPILEEILMGDNLVLLYSVPWPPQGLYFSQPVERLADVAGMPFRTYNEATARLAELAGLEPVHTELADLDGVLASGRVRGFVSSSETGYNHRVWDHMTHFYDAAAWVPRNYVFVNGDAFNGLDDQGRNCLRSAAHFAEVAGTTRARELSGWYLSRLAARGMIVAPPGEALAADLGRIGAVMFDEWSAAAGEDGERIMEAFAGR